MLKIGKLGWCAPIILAVAAVALAASPLAALAVAAAADIQGEVTTGPGQQMHEPVLVRLLSGETVVQEQLTGFNGQFKFKKVAPGSYLIRAQREGYNAQDVPIVTSGSTYHITITLQGAPIASAFSGALDPFADLAIPARARKEFELGIRELKTGQCEKAMPHWQKAVEFYPQYGDVHNEMGACYKRLGNLQAAEDSYRKAMAFSNTVYPAIHLADLYISQQRFDEAQKLLLPLLPQNPTEGDLYAALARIYFATGRTHEAELAGLEAESRRHESADVHLLLAQIYEAQHNRPALITQLKAYLDESPSGAVADRVRKQLAELSANPY